MAAGLWQTGYHAAWMYQRDGGSSSSRDLLLALGWLLAAGTLERLLTRQVQQLDKTLLTSLPVRQENGSVWMCYRQTQLLICALSVVFQVNCELSGDLEFNAASLRRLQWLIGRLRHQRRILLSTIRARTRALHHVRRFPVLPF